MVHISKTQLGKEELQRINYLFKQFECSESETKIYIQLLKLGPVSVQELAKSLKRNRVTVHSSVERLVDKGFLYETRAGKKRLIGAENPSSLHHLLQKKENDLTLMKANMDFVTQALSSLVEQSRSVPTVKLYEGVDGFKRMLEDSLNNKKGRVYVFTYVDLFSSLIDPDYLENYFVRRAKKNITTRLIFPPCPFAERVNAKAKQYKIQVRLLPPDLIWKSGIFSWDNTIAIMSYTEGKLTCTFIDNEDIAHFYQDVVFELCWQQAKPMGNLNT
ncbi:MAG: helix-turn-helix domain-containing protein [Candidatus Peribacteraceae bacterium]|jgi:predicted transcriptional regulator|nr:helix-turn-helix domain-containing protein [Candidatus Peribacteraceae bacterium]HCI03359.1 hypothetical protein [Candidatus Peribacteria bacterium]|tara:strand:- start:3999 stop:4820 length:822 start_codon:yes stop_codon:yes gene_type:complete